MSYKPIVRSVLFLLVAFQSLSPSVVFTVSAAECGDKDARNFEVATICEADFGAGGIEICPDDCGPKLLAYYEDCEVEVDELAFLVIATDRDACFDIVVFFFLNMRGSDCEMNLKAFRSMWPALCMGECTQGCSDLVDGVCNYCNGALESADARSVELELSISAPHCSQSTCSLGDGGGSSGASSVSGSSGGDNASPFAPIGTSATSGEGGRVGDDITFLYVILSSIASILF
jgi:hypothetical protein